MLLISIKYQKGVTPLIQCEKVPVENDEFRVAETTLIDNSTNFIEQNQLPMSFSLIGNLTKHIMTMTNLQDTGLLYPELSQLFVVGTNGQKMIRTYGVPRGRTLDQMLSDPTVDRKRTIAEFRNFLYRMAEMGYVCLTVHGNHIRFDNEWKLHCVDVPTCEHFYEVPYRFDAINLTVMANLLRFASDSGLGEDSEGEEIHRRKFWRDVFYDDLPVNKYDLWRNEMNKDYPSLGSVATFHEGSNPYDALQVLFAEIEELDYFNQVITDTRDVILRIEELFGRHEVEHQGPTWDRMEKIRRVGSKLTQSV